MGDNKTRENHKSPTEDRTLEFSFPRLVVIFVLLSSRPRNLLIGSLVSFANVRRTFGKNGWAKETTLLWFKRLDERRFRCTRALRQFSLWEQRDFSLLYSN